MPTAGLAQHRPSPQVAREFPHFLRQRHGLIQIGQELAQARSSRHGESLLCLFRTLYHVCIPPDALAQTFPDSVQCRSDSLRKSSSWGKSMPWLVTLWFPPFQEQAIVGDHRLVIRCFARILLLVALLGPCEGFARDQQENPSEAAYHQAMIAHYRLLLERWE